MVAKEHTLSFLQINWRIYSCYVLLLDLGMLQRQEIVASEGVFENPVFKIWGTSWWPLLLGREHPPVLLIATEPYLIAFIKNQRFFCTFTSRIPRIMHSKHTFCGKISPSSDAVYAVKIQALRSHCSYCLMFGRWKLFESFTTLS